MKKAQGGCELLICREAEHFTDIRRFYLSIVMPIGGKKAQIITFEPLNRDFIVICAALHR